MMYFGPRKLLFSQVRLDKNTRSLLVKKLVTCSCYILCPPECKTSSKDEHHLSPPPPPPPPSQKNNMPMLLIVMLCVLGAAFVCLCYLSILKRYCSNLSNSRRIFLSFAHENHGLAFDHPIWYIQTAGLEQSVIDSLPSFKYKKGDGRLVEGADCSVCLSEFEEDENLRLLPKCSHAFHVTCIDTWLRSHKNCPLCRAPIVHDANVGSNPDTTLVGTGQSGSASEDPTVVDDENGGVRASRLRISGEDMCPLWDDEQGRILQRNNGIRVVSDLCDHRVRVGEDLQWSVRRSFSMDLSSASKIHPHPQPHAAFKIQPVKEEGSSSVEEVELKKQSSDMAAAKLGNKNSGINRSRKSFSFGFGRSLQSVPIRMKRSFSSRSTKSISFRSNSRSQELVQTL